MIQRFPKKSVANIFTVLAGALTLFFSPGSVHANHIFQSTTACTKADNLDPHTIETIYARPDQAAPCRVYHTKQDVRRQVGSGNNTPPGAKSCESIEKNILTNLKVGGYQCTNDIGPAGSTPNLTISTIAGRTAVDHGRFAIFVEAFRTEDDAQIFAAGVKRILPLSPLHIRKISQNGLPYSVFVGAEVSEEAARALTEHLGAVAQPDGPILDLFSPLGSDVAADWQRYAVASCFHQGRETQRTMAQCAGLLVDSALLTSCLKGGLCAPPELAATPSLSLSSVSERVLIEQPWIGDQIAACDTTAEDSDVTACAINLMLTADQRKMLTCSRDAETEAAALTCMAGPRLGPTEKKMLDCLQNDETGTPMASCLMTEYAAEDSRAVAACFDNRTTENFAACIATNVSAVTDERVTNCAQQSNNDTIATGLCAADFYLTARQRQALDCWSRTTSLTAFGACAFADDLGFSQSDGLIAACAATSKGEIERFATCSGGGLTLRELKVCAETPEDVRAACLQSDSAMTAFLDSTPSASSGGLHPESKILEQRVSVLGNDAQPAPPQVAQEEPLVETEATGALRDTTDTGPVLENVTPPVLGNTPDTVINEDAVEDIPSPAGRVETEATGALQEAPEAPPALDDATSPTNVSRPDVTPNDAAEKEATGALQEATEAGSVLEEVTTPAVNETPEIAPINTSPDVTPSPTDAADAFRQPSP